MPSVQKLHEMRMGVFGGTFDPPHVGHLILADEAQYQLGLDRILWVLTPFPPHKNSQQITPFGHRLALLKAAISQNPTFKLSTIDNERQPPHYAVDSLRLLRHKFPKSRLVYLMGGDSLDDLPNWRDPCSFLAECDEIGVMRRPGEFIDLQKLEKEIPGISKKLKFLDAPFLEVSSSHIRQRVAEGGVYRYYLPKNVYALIQKFNLYQDSK